MPNVVFYCMETRFVMCGEFEIVIGEIGPVEVELGLSLFLLSGGLLGTAFFQQTFGQLWGV